MRYFNPFILLALFPATPSIAQTFDFESYPSTGETGAYTSLVYSVDDLTMTLSRDGVPFDLNEGASPEVLTFGQISLSPFVNNSPAPFLADFSLPLSFISIDVGDYGADSDTISVDIFSGLGGTGSLLGSASLLYGQSAFPAFGRVSLASATPFSSAVFIGGSASFPNSVYYDNITVRVAEVATAVPEPSTWAMMLIGFGLVGGAMRTPKREQKGTVTNAWLRIRA